MPVINATFETRREAELAIEHLVQEHELDRDDIVVAPDGDENSVGVEVSGSDSDQDEDDEAALNGAIKVAVTVESEEMAETVQELIEEFGGSDVTVEG